MPGERLYSAVDEYPDLENHHSHMAHCLTEEVYRRMRERETASGFSIDNAIQVGVDNPGDPYPMSVGCLAGDEESYQVFAEFFDQIIEARHNGFKPTNDHVSDIDLSKISDLGDDYDDTNCIVSCRVRSVRNIKGFALPPHCTRAERRKVERIATDALSKMTEDFKGRYHRVKDEDCDSALSGSLEKLTPAALPSCMSRDWPDARGVWINEKKNFVAEINHKDHVNLMSIEKGGNLCKAFTRWCIGADMFEKTLKESGNDVMRNSHLGYIASCPGGLGTGLRIEVRIRIPKLRRHFRFEEVLRRLRLEARMTSEVGDDNTCDVINLDSVGVSEVELLRTVVDGIRFLIGCERKLEESGNIDRDINSLQRK
ncbi:unnamed protein product [Clavelina lepadiformis]|uniref:creatine kinase n=1 Tax=Clavelina lepadiformis TaxID=159417 RepID=A0ABP0EZE6_CLALP